MIISQLIDSCLIISYIKIVKKDATGLIMSFGEFDKFNKSAFFKIDSKLYIDNEDYPKLMEVINSPSAWIKKKTGWIWATKKTKNSNREKFLPLLIRKDAKNLILGSSKPARVRTEILLL